MQKTLFAAAFAALLSTAGAASAADVYSSGGAKDAIFNPPGNWSGFYFGAIGGYAGSNESTNITTSTFGVPLLSSPGFDSAGAFGGGEAGINWQRDRIVFGIETDLQGSDIHSEKNLIPSIAIVGLPFPGNRHIQQNMDWFGTVRARLGYTFDNALFYATGGFAYASLDSSINTTLLGVIPLATLNRSSVETGYTLGAGVEYKVNPAWSFKVEYQYIDFGSAALSGNILGVLPVTTNNLNNNFNTVRLGINFHVSPAYQPLK